MKTFNFGNYCYVQVTAYMSLQSEQSPKYVQVEVCQLLRSTYSFFLVYHHTVTWVAGSNKNNDENDVLFSE